MPNIMRNSIPATAVTTVVALIFFPLLVSGQCPWSRELVDLHTDCVCAYSNNQRLSIQCSPVNFTKLITTLITSVKNIPIDLLYVSNSTIEILSNDTFKELNIQSLHLSKSKIREVHNGAFNGLEQSLTSLNVQDNLLREIPTEAIKRLTSLQLLDLSHNIIRNIPDEAFKNLPLTTLKISDNHVNISDGAFRGLEGSLKNLNLQAAELVEIPRAIQSLKVLAFLDFAQNKIIDVKPSFLAEMQSLTALNLERNRIQSLGENAFLGVNNTLSSLSLLNNLLVHYPTSALSTLTEIRVLDLGFNGIRKLPTDAFKMNKYLTLLALDGNPLSTIPIEPFAHLNSTLRGLSIGGSYLECDCRIKWIAEWVMDKGLQVTSRERNPQFCGKPEHLRRRSFYQLVPSDFICENETSENTTSGGHLLDSAKSSDRTTGYSNTLQQPTKRPKRLPSEDTDNDVNPSLAGSKDPQTINADGNGTPTTQTIDGSSDNDELPTRTGTSSVSRKEETNGIYIKHAYKRDSMLVIEWNAKPNILGFQVVIRVFGSRDFKRIIPVSEDKRRVEVENMPLTQCLLVCVIQYEDASSIRPEMIPLRQCRELKGDDNKIMSLDKVVIGTAAVICIVVIVGALIVILLYFRRRDKNDSTLQSTPMPGSMPIIKTETDWETLSWNSGRSTPKTQRCLSNSNITKSGSTSHSFVLNDNHLHPAAYPKLTNGFSKAYSTHDNESRLSYSHMSKVSNGMLGHCEIQRSKSLTRPAGYHPYTGSNFARKKKHRANGRLASASSAQSSTECESDWNGRSIWKDNDVDIYISQNHMVPGSRKYRKDYGIR